MKALILAAGKGERLRPLTEHRPKPLLEVGSRPLIHYPLLMLRRAGITEVAINIHHLAGQLQLALGSGKSLGVEITWAPEPELLGTGGPLLALKDFFGNETFAVLNADSILDLQLSAMLAFHRDRGALATIALHRSSDMSYYSRLEIDRDRRIRRMRLLREVTSGEFDDYPKEPGAEVEAGLEPYMYCGVYVCEPALYDLMPAKPPFSMMADVFAPMVARAMPLYGFVHRKFFRTVDDLESYMTLQGEFAAAPPPLDYLQPPR